MKVVSKGGHKSPSFGLFFNHDRVILRARSYIYYTIYVTVWWIHKIRGMIIVTAALNDVGVTMVFPNCDADERKY